MQGEGGVVRLHVADCLLIFRLSRLARSEQKSAGTGARVHHLGKALVRWSSTGGRGRRRQYRWSSTGGEEGGEGVPLRVKEK